MEVMTSGIKKTSVQLPSMSKLVIVESPTKARKLGEYLGKDFHVEASVGHVRDLPKNGLGVDVANDFEPTYEVSADKEDVIKKLQTWAKKADTIYLATDPDREGEAIAWHIKYLLKDSFKKDTFLRATFHEITKQAVQEAIDHPGKINQDLVDAQQARRIVDRLVGYELSPVLWNKIRRGLSAGRVQSVALRLLVEREKEIAAFVPDEYWEVDVALSVDAKKDPKELFKDGAFPKSFTQDVLVARVTEVKNKSYQPKSAADVDHVVASLKKSHYTISAIEQKERKRSSLPPFTTSTLQQASANRLGYTSKQTMRLAQQLYEEGLITYHRTDSTNLSAQAVGAAREYISTTYGSEFMPAQSRIFKSSSKNAQEAHEAIRVTDLSKKAEDILVHKQLTEQNKKLYDLIWRRFVASQMADAIYDQTAITILATHGDEKYGLRSSGSVLKFAGWMKLFPAGDDTILPAVEKDQKLAYQDLLAAQKFTQPPARFNDASLVKELEKRGIGRPSTYASIISVLEDRGYTTRDAKRFIATQIGITVSDFLMGHFPNIMDYDFTAEMEEDLDRIARGEKKWKAVLKTFYTPLAKLIEKVKDTAKRVEIPVEKTGIACPKCGETEKGEIVIRTGRFGKFKSCSRYPECDFTENIVQTLPDRVCPLCQQGDIIIKSTRWGSSFYGCGRYPDCDWASWREPEAGLKLTQKEWDEIKVKRAERKAKRDATFAKKKAASGFTPKSAEKKKKSVAKKSTAKKAKPKTAKPKKSTSKVV